MHEVAIAQSLIDLVVEHIPKGRTVLSVQVKIGPLRGIVEDALRQGWQVLVQDTPLSDAELELQMLQWVLKCPECGKEYESKELMVLCACGCATLHPVGGDELDLMSIEVDDG